MITKRNAQTLAAAITWFFVISITLYGTLFFVIVPPTIIEKQPLPRIYYDYSDDQKFNDLTVGESI